MHDTVESPVEASAADYATLVGQRLRRIRRQKGLSLQDVEALSGQEFKASVVGAYERGERIISVPRLQRLAALYRVPVDQLLPSEGVEGPFGGADETDERSTPPSSEGVSFDLTRFNEVDDEQAAMLRRYLDHIALRRQDFNGRVLTIRGEDVNALAGLFGTDLASLLRRLDELHLRLDRP